MITYIYRANIESTVGVGTLMNVLTTRSLIDIIFKSELEGSWRCSNISIYLWM